MISCLWLAARSVCWVVGRELRVAGDVWWALCVVCESFVFLFVYVFVDVMCV